MRGVFGVGPDVPLPAFHIDHPANRRFNATERAAAGV